MRKRTQAKLKKALRQAGYRNSAYAKSVSRLERSGVPVHHALSRVVAGSNCDVNARGLAARLLSDVGGDTSAFGPLIAEFISAGDAKLPELCQVIQSMNYGGRRLTPPEFEILHSVLRSGTIEQRYWVVNEISFCHYGPHVGNALVEVLDDASPPAYVRGWAAERLNRHISQKAVRSCIRATEDHSPEVRLWAVFTLGYAASNRPVFREAVILLLERMLTDEGVAPGWWSVRREAQAALVDLRGGPDEENRMQDEIQAILMDTTASVEDKRWAGFNDHLS